MPKTQISTSVSPRTRRQADELLAQGGFGTMSELLAIAIERLHSELIHKCQRCGQLLPAEASPYWLGEGQSIYLCDRCADPNAD